MWDLYNSSVIVLEINIIEFYCLCFNFRYMKLAIYHRTSKEKWDIGKLLKNENTMFEIVTNLNTDHRTTKIKIGNITR